jgi:hypothetical protein
MRIILTEPQRCADVIHSSMVLLGASNRAYELGHIVPITVAGWTAPRGLAVEGVKVKDPGRGLSGLYSLALQQL